MGFNFRKSFKIAPGIRLNVGKKGISSLSVGGKGARVSVGKKGVRTTVGIPGSGLSYSSHTPYEQRKTAANGSDDQDSIFNPQTTPPPLYTAQPQYRPVSVLFGVGIFFLPYIFAWLTLREGYSTTARVVSFLWLVLVVAMMR
ncbi:Uncharacterised protein [Acinetobacter junii]|uniref:DUF4236 domain-containing protein n=1 Tax=Acinetobacter junii TaxID=40215 RepID=UPI00191CB2A7|nr:hypothetical protein ABCA12_0226 [Acinetobacter junii]VTX87572.1 Uncharacterised protein [Acinetobacter junii]